MPVLLLGRLDDGVNADNAGIELFRDALDHTTFARRIGTFKDEDDVALAIENLPLEMEKVELEVLNPLPVLRFVFDLLGEIEVA